MGVPSYLRRGQDGQNLTGANIRFKRDPRLSYKLGSVVDSKTSEDIRARIERLALPTGEVGLLLEKLRREYDSRMQASPSDAVIDALKEMDFDVSSLRRPEEDDIDFLPDNEVELIEESNPATENVPLEVVPDQAESDDSLLAKLPESVNSDSPESLAEFALNCDAYLIAIGLVAKMGSKDLLTKVMEVIQKIGIKPEEYTTGKVGREMHLALTGDFNEEGNYTYVSPRVFIEFCINDRIRLVLERLKSLGQTKEQIDARGLTDLAESLDISFPESLVENLSEPDPSIAPRAAVSS